jgi:hypothetical protein
MKEIYTTINLNNIDYNRVIKTEDGDLLNIHIIILDEEDKYGNKVIITQKKTNIMQETMYLTNKKATIIEKDS